MTQKQAQMQTKELLTIKPEQIIVNERGRKDLGDIPQLKDSIRKHGQIQPLAVMPLGPDTYELIAGERRLTAMKELNFSTVLVRVYTQKLSEFERTCIELEENLRRKNLESTEECFLKEKIHRLHVENAKQDSTQGVWTMEQTAELLGESRENVRRDLQLAEAYRTIPGLDKAKSKSEARKILTSLEEQAIIEELAQRTMEQLDPKARVANLLRGYMIDDFMTVADKLEPETYQILDVDPPYGVAENEFLSFTNIATLPDQYQLVSETSYPTFLKDLCQKLYRIAAHDSWTFFWFSPVWYGTIYQELLSAGFKVRPMPGIWVKDRGGMTRAPDEGLSCDVDFFFYARKGAARLTRPGRSNVFMGSRPHPRTRIHPAETTIEIMEEILKTFAVPKQRLIVPFLGSGNTLIAADRVGLDGIGFEVSSQYRNAYVTKVRSLYGVE